MDGVKVPPRPPLPKRRPVPPPRADQAAEEGEGVEAEARVRFVEAAAEGKPQGHIRIEEVKEEEEEQVDGGDDDEEDQDEGTGSSGSVIMFAQMAKGALSMLDSFSPNSTPPVSPLPRPRNEEPAGEGTDAGEEEDAVELDLRGVKTYMRDLTLRLTAVAEVNAGEEGAAKAMKRGKGGGRGGGRGGGGGTIRLYHAMNKGHRRLAMPTTKNEDDDERKSESDEDKDGGDGEGEQKSKAKGTSKGGDDWAAKRRQLGEAKKADPVFVWKTLTPRQPPPSASIIDRSGLSSPLASPDSRVVRKKKQEMLRQEFIDSEATYVQNLDTIIKVYLNPLKEMATDEHRVLISAAHADLIFGRVVPLHFMHRELLEEFRKAENSNSSFVDAFFFFVPYLKLHTQYVNRHPSAIDLLLKLMRNSSRFRRFLDDCYNKTGMDAESFLILPIQRLPRYELLLTDLVRQTVQSSNPEEHLKLQTLLGQIKEINRTVEESRKREENMENMYRVHKSLVFPRDSQINLFERVSRSYEHEGQLQVCTNVATRRFESRYFFLFDDIMLCTRKRGDSYRFEYMFELKHIVPRAEGPDISAFASDSVFGLVDQQGRLESDQDDDDDDDDGSGGGGGGDGDGESVDQSRAGDATAEPQALYLKAPSPLDKGEWIEVLQRLCSRSWTRVNFVRSKRAVSVPIFPTQITSPSRSRTEEKLLSTSEDKVAVPPRPSVYRRVERKVARIRRKSGEVALNLLLNKGDKSHSAGSANE